MSDDDSKKDPKSLDDLMARLTKQVGDREDAAAKPRLAVVKAAPPTSKELLQADQRRRYDTLIRWGVPHQFALHLVEAEGRHTDTEAMAIQFVDEFLELAQTGRENMVVLAGSLGTGKTFAGAYFLERARPRLPFGGKWPDGDGPLFLHATELLALGLYDKDKQRQRIRRAQSIVIDDLGTEYMDKAGVWLCVVDWLINCRHGSPGYTAITTNLPSDDLRARYGERMFDRLRECAAWYDLGGESLRAR